MDSCILWYIDDETLFDCALVCSDWMKHSIRIICIRNNIQRTIAVDFIAQFYRLKYDYVCSACGSAEYHCSTHWCTDCCKYSGNIMHYSDHGFGENMRCGICGVRDKNNELNVLSIKTERGYMHYKRVCENCMHKCCCCNRIYNKALLHAYIIYTTIYINESACIRLYCLECSNDVTLKLYLLHHVRDGTRLMTLTYGKVYANES